MKNSNQVLITIENKWKLDSKDEDVDKYFYHNNILDKIYSGDNYYVIGRKGTGKTAIKEIIYKNSKEQFDTLSAQLNFKNFPYQELYNKNDVSFTWPNQYISIWKYLIYSNICKLMIKDESVDLNVRSKLAKIYDIKLENALGREVKLWTSIQFSIAQIFSFSRTTSDTNTNLTWVEKVSFLEDFLIDNLTDNKYIILFDELDEDYINIIKNEQKENYISLVTSLFKAIQDVRRIFHGKKIYPVAFLRDDIYKLLNDSDKTKWRDYTYHIKWDEYLIKSMLAFRISKDLEYASPLSFNEVWYEIMSRNSIGMGHRQSKKISIFDYIHRSTLMRPRDYIYFIKIAAEKARIAHSYKITPRIVTKENLNFSRHLLDDLTDEMRGLYSEIDEIIKIFKEIRQQELPIQLFKTHFEEKQKRGKISKSLEVTQVLEDLYNFSVIGNVPRQKNNVIYKYLHPDSNLNLNEKIAIHRGLYGALELF